VSLGFEEQSIMLPGIAMRTVGIDARPLPVDRQTVSDTVTIGPGESRDVIITAPANTGDYPLYNRDVSKFPGAEPGSPSANDPAVGEWLGGQRTFVRVVSSLGPQRFNNSWGE
jgi:FtsP/CotA-like multicopper oxidase with cupredoxin domain